MAQRTEAICDGKTIGIESIFTVINGKQINIPDKLNWLREKSRHNELFCPCGCGANLILVAGDKNLREQHFRIKDSDTELECTAVTEGKTSIESKIVLKCWLDDKLATSDVDTRVPINAVDNTDRKYEFSFLSMNKKIAVSYFRDRANITDEKLDVLDMNSQDIKLIYVTDIMNGGIEGQFPEWLMKIQNKQGFCLLLDIDGVDYDKARLEAVLFDQDIDGLWCEIHISEGMLSEYEFDENNNIVFRGEVLDSMYDRAWYEFRKKQDLEHDRRVRQQEEAEAERKRRQEEAEAECKRKQEEQQRLKEEYERKQREYQEEQKRLKEAAEAEKRKAAEEFARNMAAGFEQQETQITDENGVRWIKCEFCGKIAPVKEFSSYGGPKHINLGTCMECSKNNPAAAVEITIPQRTKQRYDPNICPECGSRLIERNGRNGRFMGCSGYPRCRYTRSIR